MGGLTLFSVNRVIFFDNHLKNTVKICFNVCGIVSLFL